MLFNTILSQEHIVDYFRRAIENQHLSHAYIFTGQKGLGKSLFAKELSKALMCQNKKNGHCDICRNCIRIDEHRHPDIHWKILDKKDKFLKIEKIRDLQSTASLSAVESNCKIFVIKDAERMNEEAANCLLKTIEEPTPNTFFILIANSLSHLKGTIISRCQVIRFKPIHTKVIKDQLILKLNSDGEEIEWASKFCCGSLGKAFELLEEGFFQKNNDIVNRLSGLNAENNLICAKEFLTFSSGTFNSLEEIRQDLKNLLNCMLLYYRDILIFKIGNTYDTGKESLSLFNANHREVIQIQSKRTDLNIIMKIIDEILLSITYLDYNVNVNLLIENLITRISILHPNLEEPEPDRS